MSSRWDGLDLLLVGRATNKTQRSPTFGNGFLLVPVKRSNGLGDMVARVGYGELVGMSAPVGEAVTNLSAGPGVGLEAEKSARVGHNVIASGASLRRV